MRRVNLYDIDRWRRLVHSIYGTTIYVRIQDVLPSQIYVRWMDGQTSIHHRDEWHVEKGK